MSTESIESIASSPPSPAAGAVACSSCAAPLAEDQRYCLQCGERTVPMSSVMLAGTPLGASAGASAPSPAGEAPPSPRRAPGMAPPPAPGSGDSSGRNNALTVIAGVGVLLLAMGIGVLIGRSGASKPSAAAAPQVISVASGSAGGVATPAAAESFTDDWPAGSGGYTVQLQTLPVAGTQVSAVQSAKTEAEGKGAKGVGALKSDDFPGMAAGNYVIYAGKYAKKAQAEKALPGLKQSFPDASLLQVGSSGAAKASGKIGGAGAGAGGGSSTGAGSSPSNPAPPSSVETLKGKSGKSYEQESKNLPNVVSTG